LFTHFEIHLLGQIRHLHTRTLYRELLNLSNLTNLTHKMFFTISLLYASTCFEHYVFIIRGSKLYYTASGIITTVGGRPVHSCAPDGHLQL